MVLFEWQGEQYKLTEKQDRFCHEYIADFNATQSALRAAYSPKTAFRAGAENIQKPAIRARIDSLLAEIKAGKPDKIADAAEVLERLTQILRGEVEEDAVVVEGCGDGCSTARVIQKRVAGREQVKAGELLAKGYGLLVERVAVSEGVPVIELHFVRGAKEKG